MCSVEDTIPTKSDNPVKTALDPTVRGCPSCSKRYKSSLFISLEECGHTVCKVCIYDWNHNNGSETCPICESPIPVSQLDFVSRCIQDSDAHHDDTTCYEKIYQSSGGILIRRAGDTVYYLAALQKVKNGDLQWVSPKGQIEDGESSLEAAEREIWEEVGLKSITLIDFVSKQTFSFTESGKLCKKFVFWYLFEADQPGELVLNGEEGFVESKWVTYEEASSAFSHESFVGVVKIADRILKEMDFLNT